MNLFFMIFLHELNNVITLQSKVRKTYDDCHNQIGPKMQIIARSKAQSRHAHVDDLTEAIDVYSWHGVKRVITTW